MYPETAKDSTFPDRADIACRGLFRIDRGLLMSMDIVSACNVHNLRRGQLLPDIDTDEDQPHIGALPLHRRISRQRCGEADHPKIIYNLLFDPLPFEIAEQVIDTISNCERKVVTGGNNFCFRNDAFPSRSKMTPSVKVPPVSMPSA